MIQGAQYFSHKKGPFFLGGGRGGEGVTKITFNMQGANKFEVLSFPCSLPTFEAVIDLCGICGAGSAQRNFLCKSTAVVFAG